MLQHTICIKYPHCGRFLLLLKKKEPKRESDSTADYCEKNKNSYNFNQRQDNTCKKEIQTPDNTLLEGACIRLTLQCHKHDIL